MSRLVLVAVVLSLLVAACGDGGGHGPPGGMGGHMDDPRGGHMGGGSSEPAPPTAPDAREVAVRARSFAFEPDQIDVLAGENVTIALISSDVFHDFVVDEVDFQLSADAESTAEGGLVVDEPGTYAFYCSVPGHRGAGMEGTLEVDATT